MQGSGIQKELGYYKAQEVKINKSNVKEDSKYLFDEDYRFTIFNPSMKDDIAIQKIIKEKGYPEFSVYDNYREKFNWGIKVEYETATENLILGDVRLNFFNGEGDNYIFNEKNEIDFKGDTPLPEFCGFPWELDDKKYGIWIDKFDKKELFDILRHFSKDEKNYMILKVYKENKDFKVFIASKQKQIELKNATVKLEN